MKCCDKLWKILAALVTVTAAVFVIVKFWDKILEAAAELKKKAAELKKEEVVPCEDFLV